MHGTLEFNRPRQVPANAQVDWNDAKVAFLIERWEAGYSAASIANELGCSRNSVIGKICRLGRQRGTGKGGYYSQTTLFWKQNEAEFVRLHGEGRNAAQIASILNCSKNAVYAKASKLKLPLPRSDGRQKDGTTPRRKRPSLFDLFGPRDAAELPTEVRGSAVSFADLGDDQCRWPIADKLFCGMGRIFAPNLYGRVRQMPYCSAHCLRAYELPRR